MSKVSIDASEIDEIMEFLNRLSSDLKGLDAYDLTKVEKTAFKFFQKAGILGVNEYGSIASSHLVKRED